MNKQLEAWRGAFGNQYIGRNDARPEVIRAKTLAWATMLRPMSNAMPRSILEVGANIGLNLRAIQQLTDAELYAVEPNDVARQRLISEGVVAEDRAFAGSASAIQLAEGAVDLAFTSTVLIHVPPAELEKACREIYRVSRRYILCNEYFAATPETISYRGHDDLLFKRDFGGFWLDLFPSLRLLDYGFLWRRVAAMDSTTWWVFEKPQE